MPNITLLNLLTMIPLTLQLGGLAFTLYVDSYINRKRRRILMHVVLLELFLVVLNLVEYTFSNDLNMPYGRTIVAMMGYIIRPLVIVLYIHIVSPSRKSFLSWILVGFNALVFLTALFSPIAFEISEQNKFIRGPLGYTSHVVSFILLAYLLYLTVSPFSNFKKAENMIPLSNVFFITAATIADAFLYYDDWAFSFLTVSIVTSSVFYYVWLHLQFVREHEQAIKAEQRIRIMMSQIRPHFLYNTLSTIQSLCLTDPEKASKVTENFGAYLRQNLASLEQADLVPINRALEHTRVYTEIEAVRFPSVKIEFDIKDEDFSVPALCVQPLVENAIRHGVRIRENGLVRVATEKEGDFHKITISDNGKGFDVSVLEKFEEGKHVGVRNVKERIEKMCGGTFKIDSKIGEGTTITILIPEKSVTKKRR